MKARLSVAVVGCILLAAAIGARAADDLKPSPDDRAFRPLFNGTDLTGWDGDFTHWSVENGLIVGQTTDDKPLKNGNTFLLAQRDGADATFGDFEFRVSFRFDPDKKFGNSGIQYRSKHLPANKENKWIVGGYQADCDKDNGYTGICYEERGRGIFCPYGKKIHVDASGKKEELGPTASADDLKKARKPAGQWNDYIVICKGNHCAQYLNGVLVADFLDDETGKAASTGVLALQLHASKDAMRIEFKDPRIMTLGEAGEKRADAGR